MIQISILSKFRKTFIVYCPWLV